MQAEGTVVALEGNRARVKVVRSGGCGRCHEIGGCGGNGHESHCEEFVVDNPLGARDGQKVHIEVPDGATLTAAMLMYGVPLLALLLGAGLAYLINPADAVVAVSALVCLALAVLGLRFTRRMDFVARSRARITGTLGS